MKKTVITMALVLIFAMLILSARIEAAEIYRVQSGDTLWKISQKVGVPIEIIINQNDINNPGNIYTGQRLIITISFEQEEPTDRYFNYTVKSGDVLWKIAQRYNTTVEKLAGLNNIQPPYYIYIGQTLRIPGSENTGNNQPGQPTGNYFYYTVKPGDILWNIAQRYHTTVQRLVELNNIKNSYDLYVGRRLLVPLTQGSGNYTEPEDYRKPQSYVPYFFYEIKNGDQIWTIADSFGVRVSNLIKYNNISNVNDIQPGDILIIPLNQSSKLSYLKNASSQLNNYYRVRSNETLAEIAEYFKIPEEGLRSINNLSQSETVYTGQKLLMPVSPALFTQHELYRVKGGGEYIYDIAFNKGVSIRSILQANYMRNSNAYFNGGSVIVVPLDKDSQVTWIEYDENGNPVNSILF
jgi:LysM repeat protein